VKAGAWLTHTGYLKVPGFVSFVKLIFAIRLVRVAVRMPQRYTASPVLSTYLQCRVPYHKSQYRTAPYRTVPYLQ